MNKNKKPMCPFCKSDGIRRLVYGDLSFKSDAQRKKFEKKCISAGCLVSSESPLYHCDNCGKDFGKISDNK